jgi:phosphoglycolate phosphatase-like HAD superfamily hydrolase
MIGDHVTDLESARRAGVHSAFVSFGIGAPGKEQPEQTFAAFPALTAFFLRIR